MMFGYRSLDSRFSASGMDHNMQSYIIQPDERSPASTRHKKQKASSSQLSCP